MASESRQKRLFFYHKKG